MWKLIAMALVVMLMVTGCSAVESPAPADPPPPAPSPDPTGPNDDPDDPEVIEGSGTYVGLADSRSVEIESNGEPAVYRFDPDLESAFAELLNAGDRVVFTYVVTGDGQRQLQSIDLADRAGMVRGVRATFGGLADGHTVELIIDGEPMAFTPAEQIILPHFSEGDEVIIDYYQEQDGGRLVLVRMEHAD